MISVVFPAYNEERAIADAVRAARDALSAANLSPFEIIVVDDGSSDATRARAAEAGARIVAHLDNIGYGKSLKDGIEAARHDTVVICDADGTYPLAEIPRLVAEFRKGYDMVVGAREGEALDPSFVKKILRKFLKWMAEYTAGRRIADINSGFRVLSRKTVRPYFPSLSNAFSFTTSLTLAYLLDFKYVLYSPIRYQRRIGTGKVRLLRDIPRTLQYITEIILFYNPLKLFLLISLMLLTAGAALGLFGLLEDNAWVLASSLLALGLAILSFLLGLIAVQIKHVHRAQTAASQSSA